MKVKFIVPFVIVMLSVGLISCDLGHDANYQPTITFLKKVALNSTDSLMIGNTTDGNLKLDTLRVNDTVILGVMAYGYANRLTNLNYTVKDDASAIEILVSDSLKKYFDKSSDFAAGKLVFQEGIGGIQFPFEFVAKKPIEKLKLHFQLWSDAEKVSNTSTIQLEFPITVAK